MKTLLMILTMVVLANGAETRTNDEIIYDCGLHTQVNKEVSCKDMVKALEFENPPFKKICMMVCNKPSLYNLYIELDKEDS